MQVDQGSEEFSSDPLFLGRCQSPRSLCQLWLVPDEVRASFRETTNPNKTVEDQDGSPINSHETFMARCVAQYVFKANPGADMAKFRANVKTVLVLWKKYGAETSFWSVTGGEVGNFVVSCLFPSAKAYGECIDNLAADPEFQAWTASNVSSGLSSWVRSNIAREVLLD